MKHSIPVLLFLLIFSACSDSRRIQSEIYDSLARELRLPEDEEAKSKLYLHLINVAKLDPESNVLFYDLVPLPVREADDGFYDSVIFMRKVTFRSPAGDLFVLREEIYGIAGIPGNRTLRRNVYDTKAKRSILEEYFP